MPPYELFGACLTSGPTCYLAASAPRALPGHAAGAAGSGAPSSHPAVPRGCSRDPSIVPGSAPGEITALGTHGCCPPVPPPARSLGTSIPIPARSVRAHSPVLSAAAFPENADSSQPESACLTAVFRLAWWEAVPRLISSEAGLEHGVTIITDCRPSAGIFSCPVCTVHGLSPRAEPQIPALCPSG